MGDVIRTPLSALDFGEALRCAGVANAELVDFVCHFRELLKGSSCFPCVFVGWNRRGAKSS